MPTLKQIIFASLVVIALLSTAAAQNSASPTAQSSSLTITATAVDDRVRITAPSSVAQMRVEVYAASGEKLFDQEIRGGNVFDWHLQDGQAQRLTPGTYVCVVTAKSASGKLTQRLGTVNVEEKSVSVQPAASPQLSALQAQTIGPVEENSSWTITGTDGPQTPTVIAHDGNEGQMIRGRGALTFRIGNFFTGIDTEQMRLTEAGRLGIGTSNPRATLDVAGTVRAQRYLAAKPKQTDSANTLTSGNAAQGTDAADSVESLASGTGTQDRIAKWTDNAGTLGDSVIIESAGKIGIGTPTATQALEVANGRILASGTQTITSPGGILEIGTTVTNNNNVASGIRMRNLFNGNATLQQALDVAPTFAPSGSISLARGFISAAFFAPPPGVTITDGYGGNAVNLYSNTSGAVTNGTAFAINSPVVFGALKPTNQYGVRINNQGIGGTTNSYGLFVDAQSGSTNSFSAIFAGGNVGIGTSVPQSRLHVNGDILMTTAPGNAIQFGTPNAETGMSISRPSIARADLRLGSDGMGGSRLTLALGGVGIPDPKNGIVIYNGNVGIGQLLPAAKLDVDGGSNFGIQATSDAVGVVGNVFSNSGGAIGVAGGATYGTGVQGTSTYNAGVLGYSENDTGLVARSTNGFLVAGFPSFNLGVRTFHIDLNGTYVAGSDFAESLPVWGDKSSYEPGDVLVATARASGGVEKSRDPYDVRVAGVYSTRPGMLGADKNGATRIDPGEVPVAIVGIVPTKVSAMNGRIRVGDLLTTSSTPGHAMRCTNRVKCVGAVVGKALEPLAAGKGVIKVLVMLR